MIRQLKIIFLILTCVSLPAVVNADAFIPNSNTSTDTSSDDLTTIANYLKRLGQYMGYNLETDSPQASSLNDQLLTYLDDNSGQLGQQLFEQTALASILGATPVNTYSQELKNFVPTSNAYKIINDQANNTFSNYATPSNTVSIIPGIDHVNNDAYQQDPGNQSIVNILSTKDTTFCADGQKDCLSPNDIMNKVVSDILSSNNTLPGSETIYAQNLSLVAAQLSSNNLLSPLLYDIEESSSSSNGLPTKNQAQQAGNFVRYVINELSPDTIFDKKTYSTLWMQAYPENSDKLSTDPTTQTSQINARQSLAKYFTGIRVFAAQSSVAINNIYSILSKRLAQKSSNSSAEASSQALSEYKLASWRLSDPQHSDKQWMDQLNTASPATVQKEIAILLSEINYQLYLSRKQDEQILLTNSVLLLQALSQKMPGLSPAQGQIQTSS